MKLSVGTKIAVCSGLALVALVSLGLLAFKNITEVDQRTILVSRSHELVEALDDIQLGVMEAETAELTFMIEGMPRFLEAYYAAMGRDGQSGSVQTDLESARTLAQNNPAVQGDLQQLEILLQARRGQMDQLIATRSAGGFEPARKLLLVQGDSAKASLKTHLQRIKVGEEASLKTRLDDQGASVENTKKAILYSVPFCVAIIGLASWLLGRDIARPLRELALAAQRVAKGELNFHVEGDKRSDEVGILARAFNGQIAALQQVMQDLNHAVQVIGSSATEMAASSVQMAASSSQTSAAVVQTSATVSEVRQTAEISSQEAKLVAERARSAAEAANQGRFATDAAGEGMAHIREQMEAISRSMMRLSEQSQAISEIISSVDDLTQQSNLLAVNAAIEAAKAGERGKGFGVVAQEVRSLADQSRQATAQVRSILSDVQKATAAAVLTTEQGTKSVEHGLLQFHQAGHAIRVLDESVADAAQSAGQIAMSSREQLVGMEQLAQAIESIKQASQQNVDSARQMEDSARELNRLGQGLQKQVAFYQV